MKIRNLSPLFLVISLLFATTTIPFSHGTAIYNGFIWQNDFCANPLLQQFIDGVSYPDNGVTFFFRPQSDTVCMQLIKNVDCVTDTTEPCWYEGSFTIDYSAKPPTTIAPYRILASASSNDNTSIIGEAFEQGENGLAFNTSFTHILQNTSALTWDWGDSYRAFHYGNAVLGQLVTCEGYFTIQEDSEYDFIMQMRNTSTIDVWLGNATFPFERWCSFTSLGPTGFTPGYGNGGFTIGYVLDDGPGSGTSNLNLVVRGIVQGFGCLGSPVHTVSASLENFQCDAPAGLPPIEEQEGEAPDDPIPAPPNPFGEGDQTSFIILTVEDDKGNFRNNFANGETMVFDTSLQFINDTSGLVQDAPIGSIINLFRFDEFFEEFTLIGSQPTVDLFIGVGPRARFPIVHIDDIQPTTEFRANYTGSFSANISSSISNEQTIITIQDDEIPLSIGTRLSPPLVEQNALVIGELPQSQDLFSHGEFFRVSTFLFRTDTGGSLADQTVFLELSVNATSSFIRVETIITNEAGRATSNFRTWDTRFVGPQVFRFVYFSNPPFANTISVNSTVFVSSEASDFRLTLEIIPSSVRPGDRIELRGQLTNIGSSSIGIPLSNRRVDIFVSSFDKTGFFNLQVTQNLALNIITDQQGFYSHIIFGPNIGGSSLETMDFFANSTINDIVATSANATLTISGLVVAPPSEIGDVVPPSFLVFEALINNPQANCQFSEPKICSTMLWMIIVFVVSSVLAMVASGLKIPGELLGLGWLFMMLGGMVVGVFVQAVLEIMLFIGALPVVVVLFISIGAILRGGSRGVTTA